MYTVHGRSPDNMLFRGTNWRGAFVFLLFAPVVLCATGAHADRTTPLTLGEAEQLALQDEPGHAELLARAAALDERSVVAGQLPDPMLRIGLANFPISAGNFSTEAMTQAQLGIRQVFPRRKKRILSTALLQEQANVQNASARIRSREVLAATRIAWTEAFYWQRGAQILAESRPFFEELVTITQSMYSVGRKTQYDVLRAELELSRLEDRLIDAERSLSSAQAALSEWLGPDAYRPAALSFPTWEQIPALETLLTNLAGHPILIAADAEVAVQQASVGLAEEKRKPDWALDLGYGFRDGNLPGGAPRSDFVSLSVSIDLPIFRKNRQDRELVAALNERRAALSGKQKIATQMRSQLAAEYARWQELSRRMALYETQILGLSRNQAEAALLAYQSDAGDFSDVMMGYINDLNTRLEHIRLRVERAQTYAVLANLGGLQ